MSNIKFAIATTILVLGCGADAASPEEQSTGENETRGNETPEDETRGDETPGNETPVDNLGELATCSGKWSAGIKKVGGLPGDMSEASGLASSKSHPGWGWVIRDSGKPAILYAVKATTSGVFSVKEHKVKGQSASNQDWEDVVYGEENGKGVLYILDTGAKLIYKIAEPDPNGSADANVIAKYPYSFPESAKGCGPVNNAESAFLYPPLTGKLHVVRKTSSPAGVYVFDSLSAGSNNVLKKVGDLADASCISVAQVSQDGTLLVTAAHGKMRVRKGNGTLASLLSGNIIYSSSANEGDSVEGGDFYPWGSCGITLVAEGRNTFVFNPSP